MIEIALDSRPGNTFLDKERPVYTVAYFNGKTLDDYRREALRLIKQFADTKVVIVRVLEEGFSINMFSIALFIESCHMDNDIDCVVFKVLNDKKALEEYKPYVALTIGIKYVMRICSETTKRIYQEFTELGYLGLDIERDYCNKKIFLTLKGEGDTYKITTSTTGDAIAAVGVLKALSLMKIGASVELEINEVDERDSIEENAIINKIMDTITKWIK